MVDLLVVQMQTLVGLVVEDQVNLLIVLEVQELLDKETLVATTSTQVEVAVAVKVLLDKTEM